MGTIDMQDIVKNWALRSYKTSCDVPDGNGKVFDNVRVDIYWGKVKYSVEGVEWNYENSSKLKTDESTNTMLLAGRYENDTDLPVQNTLKTNHKTEATYKVHIESGQTKKDIQLRLPLPPEITEQTHVFGSEAVIHTAMESTRTEEMTWTVDTVINTPKRSVTTAEVKVTEKTIQVPFKCSATLRGDIVARLFNKRNGQFLVAVEGDVCQIFRGEDHKCFTIMESGHKVCWEIKGISVFHFGVKHEVKVSQRQDTNFTFI